MLLYIIYVEPLLRYIEANISGLQIENWCHATEAYCDDVNVLTDNNEDLVLVDEAILFFERVSGAILSRDKKCTIIGFGAWKDREVWPLPYVKKCQASKSIWNIPHQFLQVISC